MFKSIKKLFINQEFNDLYKEINDDLLKAKEGFTLLHLAKIKLLIIYAKTVKDIKKIKELHAKVKLLIEKENIKLKKMEKQQCIQPKMN